MPLLRNEPFVRLPVPNDLKPDEEVFYCELTSEVFRKYDDYFNRTILLNSMVWTCSVTGTSGLTYEEAAKSEKSHRKKRSKSTAADETPTINSPAFKESVAAATDENTPTTPLSATNESLTPALEKAAALLTMLTGRGFQNDLLADLYTHLKDHVVVDDVVEFRLKDNKRKTGKVIAVEYCAKDKNGIDSIEQYRFTVEVSDGKKDKGKLFTVAYKDVVRRKSIISKSRCRNFIKKYCDVTDGQIYKLKDFAKSKFGLNDDQKFNSAWREVFGAKSIMPRFPYTPLSRKPGGHSSTTDSTNGQTVKNEQPDFDALALEKRRLVVASLEPELQRLNLWPVDEVILTSQTAEAESAMAKLREDLKIGREMEKERLKEEKKKMLEWKKMRDDLECDDHKPFPDFPVLALPDGLSDEQFGDCLSLQQFLFSFALHSNNDDFYDQDDESLQQFEISKKLDKKFVYGLHENFLTKLSSTSLNVNENAFLKLLQWFLAAVFEKYDDEEEEIDDENLNGVENGTESVPDDQSMNSSTLNVDSATGFFDAKFVMDSALVHTELKKTYGVSLKNLVLNHRTITEILRLFLLTSGHYSSRSRAQSRGGFRCWDDFVFALRIRRPDLVEKLSRENVLSLNFEDRLQILLSLRDQLMTFGSFRIFVQQRIDRMSTLKQELRQWLLHEQRWDKEARAAKIVLEQEVKKVQNGGGENQNGDETEEHSKRTPEMYLLLKKYAEGGRSKRDKLKLVLWEGVDFAPMTTTTEIDEVQKIQKDFLNDELSQIRNHLKILKNSCGLLHIGRDRAYRNYWYLSQFNSILVEHCSVENCFQDLESKCLEMPTPLHKTEFDAQTLLVCNGGPACPVHDQKAKSRWFLVDDLHALLETLNSRGFRESELAENLKFLQLCDENSSLNCDSKFFCEESNIVDKSLSLDHIKSQMAFEMRARLLELEENLHRRSLAFSRKADREKWRSDLDKSVSENDDDSLLKFMASCLEQLASTFDVKFFVRKSAFFSTKKQESRTFEQWCRCLQQCDVKNWSRLFLDLDTFENAVNWQKIAPSSAKSTPKNETNSNNNKSRKNSLENVEIATTTKNARRSSPPTPVVVAAEEIVADVAAVVAKPPSTKRRRIRCSSASSSGSASSSVESGEIRDRPTTTTTTTATTVQEKPQITTTSRTGRTVKRPISFEDLMTESKKNAVANRALIVHEPASSSNGLSSSSSSIAKKVQATKSTADARNQDLHKCQAILRFATHFPDAWPFLRPVSKIDAPDYYEIIQKPMDFQTLRENLENNVYKNFDEFYGDLKLIFENCRAYNESHAPVYKCGEKLEKYVNQKVRDFKT